ncbi:MAG TPA: nitroreductase family protein, partial [Pirellulaceae bacterium]
METEGTVPYEWVRHSLASMHARASALEQEWSRRRSVREFSQESVPRSLIELAIRAASSAPSGAHRQPWRFVAISDPKIKQRIRIAAEQEEYESYEGGRMPESWRAALAPLGTTWEKPYLETVPWIVVVFEEIYRLDHAGNLEKNY